MRSIARWMLVTVLVLDGVFVVALFSDSVFTTQAQAPGEETVDAADTAVPSRETLLQLGRQIADRAAELERRETEIAELIRGNEVLKRAGLLPDKPSGDARAVDDPVDAAPPPPRVDPIEVARTATAFKTLQKAYANMEPDSAASALAELAARDKQVVVQLLLGWNARTTGAVLDSLTARNPALAAELSYEIWKMGVPEEGS